MVLWARTGVLMGRGLGVRSGLAEEFPEKASRCLPSYSSCHAPPYGPVSDGTYVTQKAGKQIEKTSKSRKSHDLNPSPLKEGNTCMPF